MEPAVSPDQLDEVKSLVKEIIVSIKPPENGLEIIPDDAPLFGDGQGGESPVDLDSLDTLDMALALGERFGLDDKEIDGLISGDVDIQALRTVNDIVDFIVSLAPRGSTPSPGGAD
jgi:acyl carrier protein